MSSDKKNESGQVISFTKARDAKIEEKRRKYERVLFKNILGVYCVAEGRALKAVELVDISQEGLSFQLPANSKHLDAFVNNASSNEAKVVTFRFYFSQETFIPVTVTIINQRDCIEEGQKYVRFGATIDPSSQSYDAYKLFVMFLGKYAETAQQDTGDLKFFFF